MKNLFCAFAFVLAANAAHAEEKKMPPPSVSGTLDRQLSIIESELLPLVEAMPADKFDFKPSGDGFKDVRTFKQQAGHVAGTLELFAAILLGEKATVNEEEEKNGPAKLKTKEDYVAFLKGAFAHAHKAALSVNEKNQLEMVGTSFKGTRLGFANLLTWHSFDHYGQMVVYARSNGITPPASKGD
ncbi:MAG TPA: DinB family protein [Myxococcales bacterium]|jgi:uncharacterized damage-inducible protein DinB|nr:DinB family protein [Myxococcales bacterium]